MEKLATVVRIWIERPSLLNRRLCGAKHECKVEIPKRFSESASQILSFCSQLSTYVVGNSKNGKSLGVSWREFVLHVDNDSQRDQLTEGGCCECDIFKWIHKNTSKPSLFLLLYESRWASNILVIPLYNQSADGQLSITADVCYSVRHLNDASIGIASLGTLLGGGEIESRLCTSDWLVSTLPEKLSRWMRVESLQTESAGTLRLLSIELYNKTYQALKQKYAHQLIADWTENTDPMKYVFEDIGIAAYLLTYWKSIGVDDPKFLDLGCGNGLLSYLLSSESVCGIGVDIRSRQIWGKFRNVADLRQLTVDPNHGIEQIRQLGEFDWIIGNHSDELTPWIPIIASRLSYQCNFFLLPCCPWDLFGKYTGKSSNESQYMSYTNWLERTFSPGLGFVVVTDRLRIPSTKRNCIVSVSRAYTQSSYADALDSIAHIIGERNTMNTDFQPRPKEEAVRNCSQIARPIVEQLLAKTIHFLVGLNPSYSGWQCGGMSTLRQLAGLFHAHELACMKSQCGGIQTLLRNHQQLFKVERSGVRLANPDEQAERAARQRSRGRIPTKPCLFFLYHPNQCPLDSELCSFVHTQYNVM